MTIHYSVIAAWLFAQLAEARRLQESLVAYFDTSAEIGVMTEIIGLTAAGYQLIEQVKSGNF